MDMNPLLRPHKKYWTHGRQGTPLCLFTEVPKDISRHLAEEGLIDSQELHRVKKEVALCSFGRVQVHYAYIATEHQPLTLVLTY